MRVCAHAHKFPFHGALFIHEWKAGINACGCSLPYIYSVLSSLSTTSTKGLGRQSLSQGKKITQIIPKKNLHLHSWMKYASWTICSSTNNVSLTFFEFSRPQYQKIVRTAVSSLHSIITAKPAQKSNHLQVKMPEYTFNLYD